MIQNETNENDAIFVMPFNPEIYFLSEGKNPFSFYVFGHGVAHSRDWENVLSVFESHPPKIVINNIDDKRHTFYSQQLIKYVKNDYSLIKKIGSFDVYKYSESN